MKDLIIACAGGFGKEALYLAETINEVSPEWNILGFIDDTMPVGTEVYHGYKVIGGIKDCEPKENQWFIIGHATPSVKEKIYTSLKSRGANFATLICPGVGLKPETVVGEGSVITFGWFGADVVIGKCVHICGSMVGGATIGDFCTTTGFANIAGARLGKRVFVGSHAVVLNDRKVGDDAFICAGAIVFTNVMPGAKMLGNPAKKIDF